ncbi:MAG: hypothetical protein JST68_26440 [Bacteroidetes bacterium]|nr:hypothetical protein [Bacteroidota bacterium]
MKKALFALLLIGATTATYAQTPDGGKLKKHQCTEACKKEGHHVYAHGEKGHVCTDACHKTDKPKA